MPNIRFITFFLTTLVLISCSNAHKVQPLDRHLEAYNKIYEKDSETALKILFPKTGIAVIPTQETLEHFDLDQHTSHILHSTDYDSANKRIEISNDRSRVLLTGHFKIEIFNTEDWSLVRTYSKDDVFEMGISPSGNFLNTYENILDTDSGNLTLEYSQAITPIGYAYSPDEHYLIESDYNSGVSLIDLEKGHKEYALDKNIRWSKKTIFIDNDLFYIDEQISFLDLGDKRLKVIHKYSASSRERIASYKTGQPISCWVNFKDSQNIAIALDNGDLLILDSELKLQEKYTTKARVEVCISGTNNNLWLGTEKTGVLHLDLKNKTISNPIPSNRPITELTLSDGEKYLGVTQSKNLKSTSSIYDISQAQQSLSH